MDATPHSIADSSGGTGSATFTTTSTDESDFTFALDATVDPLSGKINSLTLGSGTLQGGIDSILARLNTDTSFGPFYAWNKLYSYNNGHGIANVTSGPELYRFGFDVINDTAYWSNVQTNFGSHQIANLPSGGTGAIIDMPTGSGTGQFSGTVGPSKTFTRPSDGTIRTYFVDVGNNKVVRVEYGQFDMEFGNGVFANPVSIAIDDSENIYVLDNGSDVIHGNRVTKFDSTGTQLTQFTLGARQLTQICYPLDGYAPYLFGLDESNIYQIDPSSGSVVATRSLLSNGKTVIQNPVFTVYEDLVYVVGYTGAVTATGPTSKTIATYSSYDLTPVETNTVPLADNPYGGSSGITGVSINGYRDGIVWVSESLYSPTGPAGNAVTGYVTPSGLTLSNAFLYYLGNVIKQPFSLSFTGADPDVVYGGWNGNAWDFIKQLCSATNMSIRAQNDYISVYDVAGYEIYDIEQTVSDSGVATISASVGGLSRKLQVVSQGTSYIDRSDTDVFYDAHVDNNNVISIDVAQVSIVTVNTQHWPVGLDQPVIGTNYTIQDSNGVNVSASNWNNAGGSITATVADNGQDINLYIVGPIYSIKNTSGPFSFTTGADNHANLTLTGWGVKTDPTTITLYTGADEEFISQDMGETITNPFIENVEQAYDRGAWASFDAAGPQIQLTYTAPSQTGGYLAGESIRIRYRDQYWRIMSSSVSSGQVSATAVPYTTVQDAEDIWGTSTVAQYDNFWSTAHGRWGGGYRVYDKKIRPLWNPLSLGPAERVWLGLDSDSVPFWYGGNAGTPLQWISIDTDGVPYYSTTRDSYGTWLDIDGRPYYAIG